MFKLGKEGLVVLHPYIKLGDKKCGIESTDFENFPHCCAESVIDESIFEMTSMLYEGGDGGVVCPQR
jgi:hypothetical protein